MQEETEKKEETVEESEPIEEKHEEPEPEPEVKVVEEPQPLISTDDIDFLVSFTFSSYRQLNYLGKFKKDLCKSCVGFDERNKSKSCRTRRKQCPRACYHSTW